MGVVILNVIALSYVFVDMKSASAKNNTENITNSTEMQPINSNKISLVVTKVEEPDTVVIRETPVVNETPKETITSYEEAKNRSLDGYHPYNEDKNPFPDEAVINHKRSSTTNTTPDVNISNNITNTTMATTNNTANVIDNTTPVVINFEANITSGSAPLKVKFTDTSSYQATSWTWNFGDEIYSKHEMNATHTFIKPGVYTIMLTVDNNYSTTKAGYITVV